MSTQRVLYLVEPKSSNYEIRTRDIQEPGPGEILVEIHSTALNPVDWKMAKFDFFIPEYPAVLGSDSAGIVKKVGTDVTDLAIGDRVVHQGFFDNAHATFQQYTIIPAEIAAKLPDDWTFDQAATIPMTMATAGLGLYDKKRQPQGGLGLYPPWEEGGRDKYAGQPILIIGGSSSVGQHAIQFAKLSGFSPIITTASKSNEAYLKSLGVTHVVDRSVPLSHLSAAVKAITTTPLKVVYDAISLSETQEAAYDALAPGGQLALVLPNEIPNAKLTGNKEIAQPFGVPFSPAQREVGKSLYAKLTGLLETGDIKPNNVEILPNGLAGIPDGLKRLEAGVSVVKLVAHPQEPL